MLDLFLILLQKTEHLDLASFVDFAFLSKYLLVHLLSRGVLMTFTEAFHTPPPLFLAPTPPHPTTPAFILCFTKDLE